MPEIPFFGRREKGSAVQEEIFDDLICREIKKIAKRLPTFGDQQIHTVKNGKNLGTLLTNFWLNTNLEQDPQASTSYQKQTAPDGSEIIVRKHHDRTMRACFQNGQLSTASFEGYLKGNKVLVVSLTGQEVKKVVIG